MPKSKPPAPVPQSFVATTQSTISRHTGPIPAPEILDQYNQIIPGGADRILTMAENQAIHRQGLESYVLKSNSRRANLGVVCAFIICMTTTLCGFWLVLRGFSIPGTIFAGSGLLGLAGTFIYGTQSQKEERLRREAANRALIQN